MKWLLTLVFTCTFIFAFSQTKTQIEIKHADSLVYDKISNLEAKRLLGHVQFRHEGADMFCDSAFFYDETNSLDAFGHVRIIQGDSLKLNGDLLKYDGNSSIARLFNHIVMTDSKMTLTTDSIRYDRNTEVMSYTTGGKIVDKENTLTSKRGHYYSREKTIYFQKDVVMQSEKFNLSCDTLKYQTNLKIAYFLGPTNIQSRDQDSTVIYCEFGWYNTVNDQSYFSRNAWMQAKEQRLQGDSILYDKRKGIGQAFGRVKIIDTTQKIIVDGDFGKYFEKENRSYVTGRTTLTQVLDNDSMFLHADTLYALSDSAKKQKQYFAYHHVKVFKTDLQGKCDSLVYATSDSMIQFFGEPVLWNEKNQLTADTIKIQLANNKVDKMHLITTAFISSLEDTLRFNQVSGKTMTAFFKNNKITHVNVEGNGQTIYYGRNSKKQFVGVNRAVCSDMVIYLDSNKVKKIVMINKPDPTFYPIKELDPSELILKGFVWRQKEQPLKKEDIYLK